MKILKTTKPHQILYICRYVRELRYMNSLLLICFVRDLSIWLQSRISIICWNLKLWLVDFVVYTTKKDHNMFSQFKDKYETTESHKHMNYIYVPAVYTENKRWPCRIEVESKTNDSTSLVAERKQENFFFLKEKNNFPYTEMESK